jgi:outer membrane protein TolC
MQMGVSFRAEAQQAQKLVRKAPLKSDEKSSVNDMSFGQANTSVYSLSPQKVVEKILADGNRVKQAELQAAISGLSFEKALGDFDWQLSGGLNFNYDGTQVSSQTNLNDRTTTFVGGLSKKFQTGTQVGLEYTSLIQNSALSSYSQTLRKPDSAQDILSATIRQPLLQNAFGFADRLKLEIGKISASGARWERDEGLETVVLQAMQLYWNAYIAQEQLRSNISAREKYLQLVSSLRRKAGFNLSQPGELSRVEAELQNAESRVKSSSTVYLSAIDELFTTLKLGIPSEVKFDIPEEIPALPKIEKVDIKTLRSMRLFEMKKQVAEQSRDAVFSGSRPALDLVAKAKSVGSEEFPVDARAEMFSGSKPNYYVGLEFRTSIDSSALRASRAEAEFRYRLEALASEIGAEQIELQIRSNDNNVTSQFAVATSAVSAVGFRDRVVREMESSYRQGRTPLIELIRAYNEMFVAQLDRARAVGSYHIVLNQLAATVDQLIRDPAR